MSEKEVRLIDANALDTLLEDVEKGYKKNFLFKSAKELRWIRDAISALRTIDPESLRPHGKWEQCFEDWRKQIEGDKCSVCGFEHFGTAINHYHYCPNCGAKMEE